MLYLIIYFYLNMSKLSSYFASFVNSVNLVKYYIFLKKYRPTTAGVRHKKMVCNFKFFRKKKCFFTKRCYNNINCNLRGVKLLRSRGFIKNRRMYIVIDMLRN